MEDRLVEIMGAEQKREKRLKTNEESLKELWENVKHTNIHIIGGQKEKRERRRQKNIPRDNSRKFP